MANLTKTFVKNSKKISDLEKENKELKLLIVRMNEKIKRLEARLESHDIPTETH